MTVQNSKEAVIKRLLANQRCLFTAQELRMMTPDHVGKIASMLDVDDGEWESYATGQPVALPTLVHNANEWEPYQKPTTAN